jgi:hypothetical protein
MVLQFLHKMLFPAKSPEASGPTLQIIDDLPLGVGQPRQHCWRGFPGNSAVSVQKAHRVTRFFEFAKDGGDQLRFREIGVLGPGVFTLDPKPKNLG